MIACESIKIPIRSRPIFLLIIILICFYISWQIYLYGFHSKTDPQKWIHVVLYLNHGGIEKIVSQLTLKAVEKGLKPSLFIFEETSSDPAMAKSLLEKGISLHFYPRSPGFSLRTIFNLSKVCLLEGNRILHTHDLSSLIYGVFVKWILYPRLRLVHTEHSFIHLRQNTRYLWYERFFTFFADSLCVVSKEMVKTYRSIGVTRSIVVINNGVPFPACLVTNNEKLQWKEQWAHSISTKENWMGLTQGSLNPQRVWILSIARLSPEKGQDILLKAWKNFQDEIKNKFQLILVGGESQSGYFLKLKDGVDVQDLLKGNVLFMGPSNETEKWYRAAEYFISTSKFEGNPLAPMEALAEGCLLLLSEIPGHLDFKDFAQILRTDDPMILEAYLKNLLKGDLGALESKKLEKNWMTARSLWCIDRVFDEYYAQYLEVGK